MFEGRGIGFSLDGNTYEGGWKGGKMEGTGNIYILGK
jgi:hypothetical protein